MCLKPFHTPGQDTYTYNYFCIFSLKVTPLSLSNLILFYKDVPPEDGSRTARVICLQRKRHHSKQDDNGTKTQGTTGNGREGKYFRRNQKLNRKQKIRDKPASNIEDVREPDERKTYLLQLILACYGSELVLLSMDSVRKSVIDSVNLRIKEEYRDT